MYMAQPARWHAEQCPLGVVRPGPGPRQECASLHDRGQTPERVCWKAWLYPADARTTAAPEAGKLPVRVCTGGAG